MNGWDFFRLMLVGWVIVLMTDLYLPAFPVLATDFGVSVHAVQLTVAFFFIGNFLSQMGSGPLIDHHGHALVLAGGLIISIAGGVSVVSASSFSMLLFGRLLQGLGAGAMQISNMALFKAICPKENLAKYASYLGVSYVAAIAVVPVFGGYVLHYSSWRMCFAIMVLSSVALLISYRASSGKMSPKPGLPSFSETLTAWWTLLTNGYFVAILTMYASVFLIVIAWVTAAPVLIRTGLHVGAVDFGWLIFAIGGSYVFAALCNARLVSRWGEVAMLRLGLLCQLFASGALLGMWLLYGLSLAALILPMMVMMAGVSWSFPNIFSLAFRELPQERMGKASALYGTVGVLGACLGSGLMTWADMDDQRFFVMVACLAAVFTCALFFFCINRQEPTHHELVA